MMVLQRVQVLWNKELEEGGDEQSALKAETGGGQSPIQAVAPLKE